MSLSRLLGVMLFSLLLFSTVNRGFTEEKGRSIFLKGDFRYRHELIDAENKDMRNRKSQGPCRFRCKGE